MWSFTPKASGGAQSQKSRVSIYEKWRSQLSKLEDAFADSQSAVVVVWDKALGYFPFASLELLENCVLVDERVKKIELDRTTTSPWTLFFCLGGELPSWDQLIQTTLSNASRSNIQAVRVYTTGKPESTLDGETIDLFEYAEVKLVMICVLIARLGSTKHESPIGWALLQIGAFPWFSYWRSLPDKMFSVVDVQQFPVVLTPFGSDAFLLSSQESFFPPIELLQTQIDHTFDLDSLQGDQRASFEAMAISLARLGIAFDRKWEVWALGPTSTLVAQFLNQISSTSPQILAAEEKASLILIDRTLDVATPLTLGFDCLADRYFNAKSSLASQNESLEVRLQPGFPMETLTSNSNFPDHSKMLAALCLPPKECFAELRALLVDLIHDLGAEVPSMATTRSPAGMVSALLEAIAGFDVGGGPSLVYKNIVLVQAAQAACYLSDDNLFSHSEPPGVSLASYALTKHLLATRDLQNVVDHINSIIDNVKSQSTPIDVRFVIATIALAVGLLDDDSSPNDLDGSLATIKKALVKLLLIRRLSYRPHWLDAEVFTMLAEHFAANTAADCASKQLRLSVEDQVDTILLKIERLVGARNRLQDYPRVLPQPGKLIPLTAQVATHIFDKKTVPLQDLQQVSFSVRGLLKTGLGLGLGRLGFGGAVLPRPTDRPTIVFFVVGGITCAELHSLREIASHHSDTHDVLFGSTTILSALSMANMLDLSR